MPELARLRDSLPGAGEALVGITEKRQRARELGAAEDTRVDPRVPYPWLVECGIVQLEPAFQVRVRDLQLAEVKDRDPERPLADHLEVGVAQPVEEVQH